MRYVEFTAKSFLRNPIKIAKEILSCDMVFDIGEGDSFSDIYGYARFIKILAGKYLATIFGVPLVMSPQTIGPFKGKASAWAAKHIMSKCEHVVARDYMSSKVLDQFQLNNSAEAIDVAFCLDFEKSRCNKNTSESIKKIGINVSGLLYNGGYTRSNQFGLTVDYKVLIDDLLAVLSDKDYLEVHLVPHVISKYLAVEDDYRTSLELIEKFPRVIISPRFENPMEAKNYIANMDLFVGARMHATIGAISSGVPVIPLAYSRKFAGLYETIGYPHVVDMKMSHKDEIIEKIMSMIMKLDEAKSDVDKALSLVDSKMSVYRNIVKKILLDKVNG